MTVPTDSQRFGNSLPPTASSTPADSLNETTADSASDSAPQNSASQWDDPPYVPEREFVLMPLFRRIGEMLGFNKGTAEVEYNYEPESRQRRDEQLAAAVPEPVSVVEDQQVPGEDALARHMYVAQTDLAPEPSVEETQPIETVELVSHEAPEQFEPEAQFEPVLHASSEPVQTRTEVPEIPLPVGMLSVQPSFEQMEEQVTPVPEEVPSPLYQQDEETAVQHYAIPVASAPAEQVKSATLPEQTATAEVLSDEWRPEPSVTEWEQSEAPALQRERAWHESEQPKQAVAAVKVSGPQLVSGSKQKLPPLWSRVDLAKQFTPQRVAVLGAVAMAVLMVLGISVARRPAASMLPEQQQVRSIQPGGVTLTTHQRRSTPIAAPRVQGRTAAPAPSASRPVARPPRAATYSEPDVVTHYYQKEKPSPVHQATVAGVRHFSDME